MEEKITNFSSSEVWASTERWQITQQEHQHKFVLFRNCSGGAFWQVFSENGLQGSSVWQGVAVLVFSTVPFLPDTGCSETHAPKDTITHWHRTNGCGSSAVRLALIPLSKGEVEPHEGLLAISLHMSAACGVSQVFVLILLAVHTVNMKRRRYRKTEDSIRPT